MTPRRSGTWYHRLAQELRLDRRSHAVHTLLVAENRLIEAKANPELISDLRALRILVQNQLIETTAQELQEDANLPPSDPIS